MRLSNAALLALPLVVSAAVHPHPHAAVHRRHQARNVERAISLPFIGTIPNIFEPASSTTTPLVPTSKVEPTTTTPPAVIAPPTTSSSSSSVSSSSSLTSSSVSVPGTNVTTPHETSTSVSPTTTVPPSTTSVAPSPTSTEEPETTVAPSTTPSETAMTVVDTSTNTNGVVTTVTRIVTASSNESATAGADSKKGGDSGLSKGAVIAIAVIASLVGVGILVAVLLICMRKRRTEDEPMRWPELNRHGDAPAHHAVPVSSHASGDRRMSLGDELDDPAYLGDVTPSHVPALNGSNFGSTAMLDYDEKAAVPPGTITYDPDYAQHQRAGGPPGYGFDDAHSDYTSYPPPVQPQPSPVHGAPYDQWDRSSSEGHHYSAENGYSGMTRQTSPTMATMAGVGAMTFPQAQVPNHHHNY